MRVNIYAEEMTDRIEIVEKEVDGNKFTALRFYLELPVTRVRDSFLEGCPDLDVKKEDNYRSDELLQVRGPFIHRPGDDDSAAVTFWGKRDLRTLLHKALNLLDNHYKNHPPEGPQTPNLESFRRVTKLARDAFDSGGDGSEAWTYPKGDEEALVEVERWLGVSNV